MSQAAIKSPQSNHLKDRLLRRRSTGRGLRMPTVAMKRSGELWNYPKSQLRERRKNESKAWYRSRRRTFKLQL